MRHSRRAFVAQVGAFAAIPAFATRPPSPPNIAAIRWPGPAGDLHGYMAIPAAARGRQPAVLIIPDTSGADHYALELVDALAVAGFVTCLPKAIASLADAVATVRWLATNPYATGRVAAVGLGWGGDLADRLAGSPDVMLSALVTFGASARNDGPVPELRFAAIGALAGSMYAAAWRQTLAFLKEHLA